MNKTIEEQIIELIKEYDNYLGNNRKCGAILNKLSNLLYDNENNEIRNISGKFAYFREHRLKASDMSLQWDIDTLKKYFVKG